MIVETMSGSKIEAVIPEKVSMGEYAEIMEETIQVDAKGNTTTRPFAGQIKTLKVLVKDTKGKIISWEHVVVGDALEVYDIVEKLLSFRTGDAKEKV